MPHNGYNGRIYILVHALPCGLNRVGWAATKMALVIFHDKVKQVIQCDDAAEESLRHTCSFINNVSEMLLLLHTIFLSTENDHIHTYYGICWRLLNIIPSFKMYVCECMYERTYAMVFGTVSTKAASVAGFGLDLLYRELVVFVIQRKCRIQWTH